MPLLICLIVIGLAYASYRFLKYLFPQRFGKWVARMVLVIFVWFLLPIFVFLLSSDFDLADQLQLAAMIGFGGAFLQDLLTPAYQWWQEYRDAKAADRSTNLPAIEHQGFGGPPDTRNEHQPHIFGAPLNETAEDQERTVPSDYRPGDIKDITA
jgi:hypothetical protein